MHARLLKPVFFACLFSVGCGGSSKKEQKDLEAVRLIAAPPGGTYSYQPWVVVKKEFGAAPGSVYLVDPGETEGRQATPLFSFDESDCPYKMDFSLTSEDYACFEVTKTGTWGYYLKGFSATGPKYNLSFTVEPVQADLTVTWAGATASLKEMKTVCSEQVVGDTRLLKVYIRTDPLVDAPFNDAAYVAFSLKNPLKGQTYRVAFDSEATAGLSFLPSHSSARSLTDGVFHYRTNSDEYDCTGASDSDHCKQVPSASLCTINIADTNQFGVNEGEFTCEKLMPAGSSVPKYDQLKEGVDVRGRWHCDFYRADENAARTLAKEEGSPN